MKPIFTILLAVLFLLSCSKEKETIPVTPPRIPEQWEKFIGHYNVYDTLGIFLYNMDIKHLSTTYFTNGNRSDSLLLQNFADTFDILFSFQYSIPSNYLQYVWTDSIIDYNGKTWGLWTIWDDTLTNRRENALVNDTIVFYYDIDNIKWYIQEAQPYYQCNCKVVAVKQ